MTSWPHASEVTPNSLADLHDPSHTIKKQQFPCETQTNCCPKMLADQFISQLPGGGRGAVLNSATEYRPLPMR